MKTITTFFATFLFLILSSSSFAISQNQSQHNYIILLDLSDRLLNPNQAEIDKTAILEIYKEFEKNVKNLFYIKSKSKFSIIILPQQNTKYQTHDFNNQLRIDLSIINTSNKRKYMDNFAVKLPELLNDLYQQASKGKCVNDYQGVDIWKYFYNQLSYELLPDYENKLIILTDGYFDFEDHSNVKKQGNFYTSTQFFTYLNSNNWKQISKEKNYGLIPIEKDFANASVIVVGIHSKRNDLYEQEKLIYFWNKWVNNMSFKQIVCIPSVGEAQLAQRIKREL